MRKKVMNNLFCVGMVVFMILGMCIGLDREVRNCATAGREVHKEFYTSTNNLVAIGDVERTGLFQYKFDEILGDGEMVIPVTVKCGWKDVVMNYGKY